MRKRALLDFGVDFQTAAQDGARLHGGNFVTEGELDVGAFHGLTVFLKLFSVAAGLTLARPRSKPRKRVCSTEIYRTKGRTGRGSTPSLRAPLLGVCNWAVSVNR